MCSSLTRLLLYSKCFLARCAATWPCPSHYAGHLATMPSADFCSITATVTCNSAIGLHRIRSQWMMRFLCAKALVYQSLTGIHRSLVKQISPDKNMDCLCTAASFTVAVRSQGFVVLCQLTFSLRLI